MAIDYRPKKNVTRNRPRKRPVKLIVVLILGSALSIYGLGIATGWLIFRFFPRSTPETTAATAQADSASKPLPTVTAPTTAPKVPLNDNNDPDLTFYYTLPKGEKGVIGSGINKLPRTVPINTSSSPASPPPDKTVPPATQAVAKKEVSSPAPTDEKKVPPAVKQTASTNNSSDKGTYTIQVAAFHEKKDALELKEKLRQSGFTAHIDEYTVNGKVIWHRVRVGRKLDRDAASKLAVKIGRNAIPIAE